MTERSNDRESPATLEKLRRAVIESSKQCGRNRLMTIAPLEPWEDFLRHETQHAADSPSLRLVAHPGGGPLVRSLDDAFQAGPVRSVALAVGPEGGFTDAEIEQAATTGWQLADLGPAILRVETAALAVVAAVVSRLRAT